MPIPALLAALGTVVTITLSAFGPAYRYAKEIPAQREANAKALDLALQKAAAEGMSKDYIRRIEVKPYSAIRGYYEITYSKTKHYVVIYENGTIAEKQAAADWIRHVSPQQLNNFYSQLRSNLETTPAYKQKGLGEQFQSEVGRLLE